MTVNNKRVFYVKYLANEIYVDILKARPDVRLDRRFIAKRDGKDVVLFAGLLDLLHQLSAGYFDISTQLVQVPSQDNGQTAICTARVVIFDPDNPDVARRVASGIGDASPGNVTRMMAPHLIRMAETRAKARALRDAVNVGMVSLEELGGDDGPAQAHENARRDSFGPPTGPRPVPARIPAPAGEDTITLDGTDYSRAEVVRVKHQRIAAARAANLFVPAAGAQGGPPPDDAPLDVQVRFSAETKRRLEARSGAAARSSGT